MRHLPAPLDMDTDRALRTHQEDEEPHVVPGVLPLLAFFVPARGADRSAHAVAARVAAALPVSSASYASTGGLGWICVRQSFYSVPVGLARRTVTVRLGAHDLEAIHAGKVMARHVRSLHKGTEDLLLDHYLEILTGPTRPFRHRRRQRRDPRSQSSRPASGQEDPPSSPASSLPAPSNLSYQSSLPLCLGEARDPAL